LNNGESANSIELDFSKGLMYFGTNAESIDFGAYTVSMALYHDATLINTFSVNSSADGAGDGSAAFLGFLSSDGINRVILSASQGNSAAALAIGDVTVAPVPEPASMMLLGSGLASMAGVIRRKRQK
jgi:hypothetical protein